MHLIKLGFRGDCFVDNVLLDMYVKLGSLCDGVQLFDEMRVRNVVSWCTLIAGFVDRGLDLEGLCLFEEMVEAGLRPNHFVLATVIKACAGAESLQLGVQLHCSSTKSGLLLDGFVLTGLIDMYAKCGRLRDAHSLSGEVLVKTPASWNTLISGYIWNFQFEEALKTCLQMLREGCMMDTVTLRSASSAVSNLQSINFGNNLYAYSTKIGLSTDYFFVLELLKLWAMVGEVDFLWKVFHALENRDATMYSCVISTFHQHGCNFEALQAANDLLASNVDMNQGAIISLLIMCQTVEEGRQMHAYLVKSGYTSYLSVSNSLLSFYVRCNKINDAGLFFLDMPLHDLISWTSLMTGHIHNHQFKVALELFSAIRKTELALDHYMIATMINASAGLYDLAQGKQFHSLALKVGINSFEFITTSLMYMYAKCGSFEASSMIFSLSAQPHSLVSVNILLYGYLWNLQHDKVLEVFIEEVKTGMAPDEFTFSIVLGACVELRFMEFGCQIHACITKTGYEHFDAVIGNAITNLHIKCGNLDGACKSFDNIICKDPNSYSSLMAGFVQNKDSIKALKLFHQMERSGLRPNSASCSLVLRTCTDVAAVCLGEQVHAFVYKVGFISDVCVANAIICMYAKSSHLHEARKAFDEIIIQGDVPCKALITGYSQFGNRDGAFKAFDLMKEGKVCLDYHSYVGLLSVCAGWAALSHGMCVHAHVVQIGLDFDVSVGNALVGMYAKCGSIKDSWKVFQNMEIKNVISWNAMVSGYAQHGLANKALDIFEEMRRQGLIPDHVTYLAVLSACGHVGLVDEGFVQFKTMTENHGMMVGEAHYACMVDILSRAGRLYEAHWLIVNMPMKPSGLIWRTLLAACSSHGNVELGMRVACNVLGNGEDDSALLVLLSNIYAMGGRWMDVECVRKLMAGKGMRKEPGCSWIELKNSLKFFLVGGERKTGASEFLFQHHYPTTNFDLHPLDHG